MSSTEDVLQEEAFGWLIRLRDGGTGDDWVVFTAWLESDPRANVVYERAARADRLAADLPSQRPVPVNDDEPSRRPIFRRWWSAAAIAAMLAAAIGGVQLFRPTLPLEITTLPGDRRTVMLADGTRIELNGGGRIRLANLDVREVRLEAGQATFTVVHDVAHPFEVVAGSTTVRDLGTTFDVARQSGGVEVAVASGRVAIDPAAAAIEVGAGQVAVKRDSVDAVVVRATPAGTVGGWRRGRLAFRDEPLREVAATISRTSGIPIRVDADVASRPFTGLVLVDGPPEELVARMGPLLDVQVTREGAGCRWRSRPRAGN